MIPLVTNVQEMSNLAKRRNSQFEPVDFLIEGLAPIEGLDESADAEQTENEND